MSKKTDERIPNISDDIIHIDLRVRVKAWSIRHPDDSRSGFSNIEARAMS